MDKATRIIGYMGLIPLLIGSLFKIQHWPFAGILIVLSVSLLVMVFMPMYIIHRITRRTSTLAMIEGVMMGVTGMFVLLGMMFKIQHWPGGGVLLIVGNTLLAFTLGIMILRAIVAKEYKQNWQMLGLMFAVTMVFFGWSLDWSRDFLVSIQHNDALIQRNHDVVMKSNLELKQMHAQTDSTSETLSAISERSLAMKNYISELQNLIITACLGQNSSTETQALASDVKAIDNYDIPTYILIGYDPSSPSQDDYSAYTLRLKLTEFATEMKALSQKQETQTMIDSLYSFTDHESNGIVYSWEMMHFYHASYASVMQSLNTLQLSVALTENRLLHERMQAYSVGKTD
ncbi:MAG: hypothetical protein RLP15_00750 [Cryomorphaceae bacterium]